jgi:hypothetical protein
MPTLLLDAVADPDVVRIPARTVLAIDGAGAPAGDGFQEALGALYGVTYTLKFARKREATSSFRVGALEGRWWAADEAPAHGKPRPELWRWQLRLAVPDDVDETAVARAIEAATTRKGGKLEGSAAARRVRAVRLPEQRVGRALHVGPYSAEAVTLACIDARLAVEGFTPARSHVEIYLGDPRRAAPEKLRTVLLREIADRSARARGRAR